MPDGPAEIWTRIRSTGLGDGNLEVPSITTGVETGYGPALFAVGPEGQPRLLVPHGGKGPSPDLGSGPNLHAGQASFLRSGRNCGFLDVMVTDRRLDAVFAELVAEILVRLSKGHTPQQAIAGAINDFRDLLASRPSPSADASEICGLVGELLVLERLAAVSSTAIACWTGPYEQRHDFRKGGRAIEVKSSMRSDSTHIKVNGAEQMLPPSGGTMVLVHVRMERSEGGALTISGMHDRLLKAGIAKQPLMAGLAELGCTDPDAPGWNGIAFDLEGIDMYRVGENFPCIVPPSFAEGALPGGVGHLTYDVDLTFAAGNRVPTDQHAGILREFLT